MLVSTIPTITLIARNTTRARFNIMVIFFTFLPILDLSSANCGSFSIIIYTYNLTLSKNN